MTFRYSLSYEMGQFQSPYSRKFNKRWGTLNIMRRAKMDTLIRIREIIISCKQRTYFNSVFQSITGLKRLIDKAHRMQISNVNSSAENDYFFFQRIFCLQSDKAINLSSLKAKRFVVIIKIKIPASCKFVNFNPSSVFFFTHSSKWREFSR